MEKHQKHLYFFCMYSHRELHQLMAPVRLPRQRPGAEQEAATMI
jgi:hypothetical protein